MAFESGFLEVGTTPQDVLDVLEGMLINHPAWEYVEEVAVSGHPWRIWKCLGTENDFGADFHVALNITSTATSLRFNAFENWNPANKGLRRPCVRSSTTKACGADGSLDNGQEYTTGVNYFGGTAMFNNFIWAPDAGGVEYWFSVTQNRIIAATRRSSDNSIANAYVGHFESFIPDHPNEHPLVNIQPHQTSTSATVYTVGAWSRHPGREGITNRENFAVYPMIAGVASDWTKSAGTVGSPGTGDLFHDLKPVGSRMLSRPLPAGDATWGHLRGLYYNILDISVVAGVTIGDTVTIDGDTWVYMGANSNWMNASV